ncbi:hypothetical protein [Clostridium sp. AWRP]|uniref:hypothetical protein n=1 Tax=Clostridium sp. AWRP TaxID=2212991 RepID=UPI000FD7AEB4|nr:hypothetical protein [Clostridium sp. AWRP]AZV57204.1 hypothetical protein DMR38_11670 [Clostridium sp. AWRP]
MIRRLKNKLFATLCVAALTLGTVAVPSSFNSVQAAGTTKTVYVDVEKNVLGQDPILQPKAVTLSDTATIADATKQAVGDGNVNIVPSQYGSYITGFKDTTDNQAAFNNNYKFKTVLNNITKGIVFDTTKAYKQNIVTDPNYLSEKECDGISGWMFTVNNKLNHDSTPYNGGTTLTNVPDGAVIRWEFTAAMGADMGLNSAYLPTEASNGYYDWSTAVFADPFFIRADKTALITKLATTAKPASVRHGRNQYIAAQYALKNLTISQHDVDNTLNNLNNALK